MTLVATAAFAGVALSAWLVGVTWARRMARDIDDVIDRAERDEGGE